MSLRVYTLLSAATAALYCIMVFVTLPRISDAAGGLMPFDLRPFGYSEGEAATFLEALGREGAAYYRAIQHRLDMAFAPLLAMWISATAARLFAPRFALLVAVVALASMVADLGENHLVGRMIDSGDSSLASLAARFTLAKSLAVTLAMCCLLVGFVRWLARMKSA